MKLILKAGLLAAVLTAFVGSTPAHALFGGSLAPASKCIAGKAKCIIKKKSCLLGCFKKVPGSPDPACLGKCRDKFDGGTDPTKGCFAKLEAKGGCGASVNDTTAFEAKIDAHVLDIMSELNPAGTTPVAELKCLAGKIGAITKYNACVLGLVSKAAGAGAAIDTAKLAKCRTGIGSGIAKLDAKGNCLTGGDAGALKNKDDAFVDDVINELLQGPNDQNNQRCTGDTSVHCTSAPGGLTGCGGPLGTCEFFFGAPLSLAAGGVTTCVANQWNGGISGTFDQSSGASAGTASVISRVYNGVTISSPCPVCQGDPFVNDGVRGGTCVGAGSPRNGQPCDAEGTSAEPSFGPTSLDCPPAPGGLLATIPIDLTNTDAGAISKAVDATSPTCNGLPGSRCLCASCSGNSQIPCDHDADCAAVGAGTCTNAAGEPRKPNACLDDTNTAGTHDCAARAGGEGECTAGPVTQHCHIETFKGCTMNSDCPLLDSAGGQDFCDQNNRECFPNTNSANGVGDSVSATGTHGTPRNHYNTQSFSSVFCVSPTGSASVNSVAGLPGPGRLNLGGVGAENGTSSACPTQASFIPTVKGGVLDTGWTGISHDAKVIGGGKVTVSVTGCSNPGGFATNNCGVCTYTGPIANANANP